MGKSVLESIAMAKISMERRPTWHSGHGQSGHGQSGHGQSGHGGSVLGARVCVWVRMCVRVCVCARVHACVRERMRVRACARVHVCGMSVCALNRASVGSFGRAREWECRWVFALLLFRCVLGQRKP
jgi:hypothetical protein